MPAPRRGRVAVVTFPGSNCDADVRWAVGLVPELEPVAVWHKDTDLGGVEAVILPGGFSYGDYLRSGAIARFSPIMREVVRFAEAGGPVLGICNGFQILTEAGLLPGALMRNAGLKFLCQDTCLKVERTDTAFTLGLRGTLRFPIAHMDGNWQADADTLARVEGEGLVAFRYVNADGSRTPDAAPNGSLNQVAGLSNPAGNVVGLMPHPDRVVEDVVGGTQGLGVLRSLVGWLARGEGA